MTKTKSKLIFAVLSLVIALTLATSTTFAWFTTNSRVSTGNVNMEIATTGELFISTAETPDWAGFTGTGVELPEDGSDVSGWTQRLALLQYTNKLAPVSIAEVDERTAVPTFKTVAGNVVDPTGTATSLAAEIEKSVYKQTIHFAAHNQYDVYLDFAEFDVTAPESQTMSVHPYDWAYFPEIPAQNVDGEATAAMLVKIVSVTYNNNDTTDNAADDSFTVVLNIDGANDNTTVNVTPGIVPEDYVAYSDNGTADDTADDIAEKGTHTFDVTADATNSRAIKMSYDIETAAYSPVDGSYFAKDADIDSNAQNGMRIAFLVDTLDAAGAVDGKELIVYDPHKGEAWSAYGDFNIAHEVYDAVMREPLLTDDKTELVTPVGSDELLYKAGASSSITKITRLVNQVPFAAGTDDAADTLAVWGTSITMYVWLEGTDADCVDALAGYSLLYSLGFMGELVPLA